MVESLIIFEQLDANGGVESELQLRLEAEGMTHWTLKT